MTTDIGYFVNSFNKLKYCYVENGESKIKTWYSYQEFVADGGVCEGFDTSKGTLSPDRTCVFKYNGASMYLNYTLVEPAQQE